MADFKCVARINELYDLFEKTKNVDSFTKKTGDPATVYVRSGDNFLRVSTTLLNEHCEPALCTTLDRTSPAFDALIHNREFIGEAELFGRKYFTKYAPYFTDDRGVVIALFVGIPLKHKCREIRECKCGHGCKCDRDCDCRKKHEHKHEHEHKCKCKK